MINEDLLYQYGFKYESLTGTYDLETNVNGCTSLLRLRPSGYYYLVDISGFAYPIRNEEALANLMRVCECPTSK